MAAPILQAILSKTGRTLYKKGSSFISKKVFERESNRGSGGRFLARSKDPGVSRLAAQMMEEVGPPIGGGDWSSRVRESTERFEHMMGNNNQLG